MPFGAVGPAVGSPGPSDPTFRVGDTAVVTAPGALAVLAQPLATSASITHVRKPSPAQRQQRTVIASAYPRRRF